MKKSIVATLAIGIGLTGGAGLTATTAHAKTIGGFPSYFCHTWYHGKEKVKLTKHSMTWGKTGHKFGKGYHFSHVYKYGRNYIPALNADTPEFKYSHNHVFVNEQTHWAKFHR
ncbi:hypothetical protein HC026_11035 [Lactobacillus sp. LC28-10]|uniref:Lactococcin 972 family bacteriocin n=1 Tax=Secundilactobacillus angelensis TaxID=2722706 RepID=A0ABX1KZR2_9LACO|nr:hypothetical protein [Secundilactobacillus angelensis]MCH5463214.1 hypothetical protein [Secundilactobacillus angelensis]NLR19427.1 hypothetical protein [Secundilactobacillus angelensis]